MPVQPSQTLSHYRLIEKIGEGGMGVVWKAEDTVLNRIVAIKVLQADVSRDETRREMFLTEAQLAAQVGDAHIVQVYEFGREGDLDFIVMEYVEGNPLNKMLHGRPLPPHKVADFGHQIAHALSKAHRKQLLHRDLKPANILVTPDGEAKVVDFGLATLFAVSSYSQASTRTTEQPPPERKLAGTLAYMSPEQARMEQLDGRSDVFSLGSILYEMTTGQLPFTGPTSIDVLQAVQQARPKPVHDLVPQVPLELDRIIQKAMASRRRDRYQSMEDLAVDLSRLGRELESGSSPSYEDLAKTVVPRRRPQRLLIGLAGAIALAVIALGVWWFELTPGGKLDERTVLIIPMEVRGQAEDAEYLGRAFAEAIAIQLTQARDLKVLPVADDVEAQTGIRARAREAGAGRVVTGAVSRHGDSVQASVQLLDATENRILWGDQQTVSFDELPSLASSLAHAITRELNVSPRELYDTPARLAGSAEMSGSRELAEAVVAWKRGSRQAYLNAVEQLLQRFPRETAAHVHNISALYGIWFENTSPGNTRLLEESLATLSSIDPANPYCDIFRGFILVEGQGRYEEGLELFSRVLNRDDLTPEARVWVLYNRGGTASALGQTKDALRDYEQAIRLNPLASMTHATFAGGLNNLGRFEQAKEEAERAMLLDPANEAGPFALAEALYHLNEIQPAAEALEPLCTTTRASRKCCALYAACLHRLGRSAKALEFATRAAAEGDVARGDFHLARYWILAGNPDESLRYLRLATSALGFRLLPQDPDFTPLHGDPEFEAIVAEVRKRSEAE